MGGKSGGSQPSGYEYFAGVQLIPCHGPVDKVSQIIVGERLAWFGDVVSSETIEIEKPNLFGGHDREGGVRGQVDVMMGGNTQPRNTYLADKQSPICPAYRGLLSLVFRGVEGPDVILIDLPAIGEYTAQGPFGLSFMWSAMNPYFKQPWVRLTRILVDWRSEGGVWYSAKAAINEQDMNPAHILYQVLTDPSRGMGYPVAAMDDTGMRAAADTLYDEGFGLSLSWTGQSSIEAFVNEIEKHVNGHVYQDNVTGLFNLKLIRDDYSTPPELNPSNSVLRNFQRAARADTVNEVVVTYRDRDGDEQSVSAQSLAGVNGQGRLISSTREYRGVREADLAARLAARDLATASAPLAKCRITANRIAYNWQRGDVFTLSWPDRGIESVVMRITEINKGNPTSGGIDITAVEDVFGLPTATYTTNPGSVWENPTTEPGAARAIKVVEAPYWDVVLAKSSTEIADLSEGYGFTSVLAARPVATSAINYQFAQSATSLGTYTVVSRGQFAATALTTDAIDDKVVDIELSSLSSLSDMMHGWGPNLYAYLGDEVVIVVAYDRTTGVLTVERGALDTVPVAHAASTRLWFGLRGNYDPLERTGGETSWYKVMPQNGMGVYALASATPTSVTFDNRASRPYPPGNVRVNGEYRPAEVQKPMTDISWSHRDRLQQTAMLIPNTTGNIGPEDGTTYDIKIYRKTWADDTLTLCDELTTDGTVLSSQSAELILPGRNDFYGQSIIAGVRGRPANDFLSNVAPVAGVMSFTLQRPVIGETYRLFIPDAAVTDQVGVISGQWGYTEFGGAFSDGDTSASWLTTIKGQIDDLYDSDYRAIRDAHEIAWSRGRGELPLLHRIRSGSVCLDVRQCERPAGGSTTLLIKTNTAGAVQAAVVLGDMVLPTGSVVGAVMQGNGTTWVLDAIGDPDSDRVYLTYQSASTVMGVLSFSLSDFDDTALDGLIRREWNLDNPASGIDDKFAFGVVHDDGLWVIGPDRGQIINSFGVGTPIVDPAGDSEPSKWLKLDLGDLTTVSRTALPTAAAPARYYRADGTWSDTYIADGQQIRTERMGYSGGYFWTSSGSGQLHLYDDTTFAVVKWVPTGAGSVMVVANSSAWVGVRTYGTAPVVTLTVDRYDFSALTISSEQTLVVPGEITGSTSYAGDTPLKFCGNYLAVGYGPAHVVLDAAGTPESEWDEMHPLSGYGLTTTVVALPERDIPGYPPCYHLELEFAVECEFDINPRVAVYYPNPSPPPAELPYAGSVDNSYEWVYGNTDRRYATNSTAEQTGSEPVGVEFSDMTDATFVRIEIKAVRDGLDSWQTQVLEIDLLEPYGLGYRLGEDLGGVGP